MSDLLVLNAVNMLADRMAMITVGFKAAEFIRLLRKADSTAAQVQAWLLANPDQYRDIFDNYYATQAILADSIAAKLIYDSKKGAELAINSYAWMSEFVRSPRNVDLIMTSAIGMHALWSSGFALNFIHDSKDIYPAWKRFYEIATLYSASWGSGQWGGVSAANGTYYPFPNATGKLIVISFRGAGTGNLYRLNSRIAGGPEIETTLANQELSTFASHNTVMGTRYSGNTSGSGNTLRCIAIAEV